jgi:hypothetical protein
MKKSDIDIHLNFFEFGYLYGSINRKSWDRMPRTLWLKLHINLTKAYKDHEMYSEQAREDIAKWERELSEIENRKEVKI